MCPQHFSEEIAEFDVEGHVEDLVVFFVTCGLSPYQMLEALEELVLDALGANQTKH